jgi:murein DD-endopeptidase MepM/ murein hydrolase activator NlpD
MRARVLALLLLVLLLLPASAAAQPAASAPVPAGLWVAPLGGSLTVTRAFERLPHPYAAGHRGADLLGEPFGPVLAAGDGLVVFAGMVAGRPVVSIDHADGLRTTYEPVAPSVAAGSRVTRGSPIGTLQVGHEGCPVQACLHWGLRRGETYLDPLLLLRPPRVRLLPLGLIAGARARSGRAPLR